MNGSGNFFGKAASSTFNRSAQAEIHTVVSSTLLKATAIGLDIVFDLRDSRSLEQIEPPVVIYYREGLSFILINLLDPRAYEEADLKSTIRTLRAGPTYAGVHQSTPVLVRTAGEH